MRNHPPKFGVLSIETLVQKWKVGGTQGGTREILCGGPIGSGFYQINCLPVERISPCSTLTIPGKHIRFLACVFMNWEAKNRHNTPVLAMEIQVMSSRPRALAEIQRQRMRCQSVIAIEVRANNLHRKVHFGQQANHLMLLRRAETQSKESRPKFDPPPVTVGHFSFKNNDFQMLRIVYPQTSCYLGAELFSRFIFHHVVSIVKKKNLSLYAGMDK